MSDLFLKLPEAAVEELVEAVAERVAVKLRADLTRSRSDWLDLEGMAAHLAIPVGTLKPMIASGQLDSVIVREGRRVFSRAQDLDRWRLGQQERGGLRAA